MSAVARSLAEVAPAPSVVTVGNFDGVHRGHLTLLGRAVRAAQDADGVRSVAVTFDPHPAAVLRPGAEPPRLQTLDARVAALTAAGIDLVLVLPFTRQLATLTPRQFVDEVLVERLQAVRVVVGTNFRFGAGAAGNVVTLADVGEEAGFVTEAITLLDLDGIPLSSSSIRTRLLEGDVAWAARALGRPYALGGVVVRGDGRGRTIGVPTANIEVDPQVLLPADGVYAGVVELDGVRHNAVTNIGLRPTFAGAARTVEAHLLDVELDLYGQVVEVTLEHRIRGEQRFDGVEALVAAIRADVATARALLAAS